MIIVLQCTPDQFHGLHVMIGTTGGPQVVLLCVTIEITGGPQVQGRMVEVYLMKGSMHQAGQGVRGARAVVLQGLVQDLIGKCLILYLIMNVE